MGHTEVEPAIYTVNKEGDFVNEEIIAIVPIKHISHPIGLNNIYWISQSQMDYIKTPPFSYKS